MNETVYKQYDSRWGNLPYPGSGSYLSDSGCGCLAVYHAAIELAAYQNLTVPQCRDYMVQFATVKNGTLWEGITKGLEHYGYNVHWRQSDSMTDIFRELQNSCKRGVILFAKDGWSYGPDGTLWTKSGHFIYFGDYKVEGNKHWFKLYDSGQRDHDGWYCYETSMKTCVKHVWICKSAKSEPAPTPTPTPDPTPRTDTYQGLYPVVKLYLEPGDRGENVTRLQNYIDWYYKGVFFKECGPADGIYGKNTLRWVNKMLTEFFGADEADGLVGPKTIAEMKRRGGGTSSDLVLDISNFNDVVDFNKVKASGIKGVIVRCGLRHAEGGELDEDSKFIKYIKAAYNAGLACGIYFFTEAINEAEGREEARYALDLWKKAGVPLHYPIGVDSENVFWDGGRGKGRANSGVISAARRTDAICGFCDEITKAGYEVMIYASTSWFNNQLNMSKLPYHVWCAQYYDVCEYKGKYIMWQYTSKGSVNGINGVVDMNHCYYAPKKMDPPKDDPAPTPTPTPSGHYTGKYPEVRVKRSNAEVIANAVKWAKWIAANNDFHYGWGTHSHHNGCYFCGTQPSSKKSSGVKMWETTYCCNPFVHAAWAHGGLVPRALSICSSYGSWDFGTGSGSYHTSSLFTKVSTSDLKIGDVLCSDSHVALYIGDGKVVQAGHSDNNVPYSSDWNSSISIGRWNGYTRAYRFNSSVDADIIMRKGEVSERVADLQRYLVWYGALPQGEEADGIYGEKTFKAVVKMQTDFFGAKEADGTIGPKTIAKMKEVVR